MELAGNCVKTTPLEQKHFSVVMPQKQGLQRRGTEPKPIITQVELVATTPVNQTREPNAATSHPGVLGSPETYGNPKPALTLLWKLQITPVFTGVLIKFITTGLSELIPFLHRTCCTVNFRVDARIKKANVISLKSFSPIHKNELIAPQQFQATWFSPPKITHLGME